MLDSCTSLPAKLREFRLPRTANPRPKYIRDVEDVAVRGSRRAAATPQRRAAPRRTCVQVSSELELTSLAERHIETVVYSLSYPIPHVVTRCERES